MEKIIFVILDGAADLAYKEIDDKTPLEFANKPFMNNLAKYGALGRHIPYEKFVAPGSGIAHLMLFGYDEKAYPGRGVFEALGAGIKLKENEVAYRINFAYIDENYIIKDRRIGRNGKYAENIAKEIEKALNENPFGFKVKLYHTTQHRGIAIFSNLDILPDLDPHKEGVKLRSENEIWQFIIEKVKEVSDKSIYNKKRIEEGLVPINAILFRGGGKFKKVKSFEEKYGFKAAGIASNPLYLGVAKYVGMDVFNVKDEEKPKKIKEIYDKYDFFFIHFKETDNASHDGDIKRKIKEIEKVDKILKEIYEFANDAIWFISADHATPCKFKQHSGDYVPFLIYGGFRDNNTKFDEKSAINGYYGTIYAKEVIWAIKNAMGKEKEKYL